MSLSTPFIFTKFMFDEIIQEFCFNKTRICQKLCGKCLTFKRLFLPLNSEKLPIDENHLQSIHEFAKKIQFIMIPMKKKS